MLQTFKKMQKQKTEEQFGTSFLSSRAINQLYPRASFIRELDTPHGRPDVVLFDTRPSSRWSIMAAILNSPSTTAFALVFFTLKEATLPVDIQSLCTRTGLSRSYLMSAVRALLNEGLVVEKNNGFALSRKARIPNTNIVSIEFKLHDWKKALQQAVRHLAFADQAYVIMPIAKRDLLNEHKEIFRGFGVSIAVFDAATQDIEVILDVSQQNKSEISYIDIVGRIWSNRALIGQV
jgi:hypothetical protein